MAPVHGTLCAELVRNGWRRVNGQSNFSGVRSAKWCRASLRTGPFAEARVHESTVRRECGVDLLADALQLRVREFQRSAVIGEVPAVQDQQSCGHLNHTPHAIDAGQDPVFVTPLLMGIGEAAGRLRLSDLAQGIAVRVPRVSTHYVGRRCALRLLSGRGWERESGLACRGVRRCTETHRERNVLDAIKHIHRAERNGLESVDRSGWCCARRAFADRMTLERAFLAGHGHRRSALRAGKRVGSVFSVWVNRGLGGSRAGEERKWRGPSVPLAAGAGPAPNVRPLSVVL